jgi:uncharacterized protein with GYD domain
MRFLISGTYTAEGAKGLLKEGGTRRKAAIEKLFADAGGALEAYYWAFGETDFYLIAEVPDAATAAALGLTTSSSGFVRVQMTALLTAEEIDQAAGKKVDYRGPGS